ncbi:MAG: hypothetical protein Q7K55_02635 [Candidatus Levybacteria bacterium]|nr:hypothetical protein [Candidatus Levybacteria bacterium]
MEKEFIQIQLGIFFKNDFQGMPENASLIIKEQFGNDLNAQIIGIPNNAPSEIPRVVINSPLVNVNLSKNRIDFFSKDKTFITANQDKIFNVLEKLSVAVGRVGVVFTYFKEANIEEIKSLFDKSKISSLNPTEITIRFNEKAKINEIISNNSQLYVSGFANDKNGSKKEGVVVTRDINSLQEDINKNEFNKETFKKFVLAATAEADKTLI